MDIEYLLIETKNDKITQVLSEECEASTKEMILQQSLEELKESEMFSKHSIDMGGKYIHFVHTRSFNREQCTGFLSKVLNCSNSEIYVYDKEGKVLYGSKTIERFGICEQEIIGKTAMYLVEQGFADKTPIPEVIKTGKTVTLEQKTATGKQLTVRAIPYKDNDGGISFIVENCTDIMELSIIREKLKEKELEVQRYRVESENLKKLEGELFPKQDEPNKFIPKFKDKILKVSKKNVTILILGESGTGKSYLAQYIHKNSQRANKPFICINCSTIAPNLFESELFGYAPGAFTGAKTKGKNGLIDLANGGTLFLDEIGEVPIALQGKLLELIQDKRYIPVGALRYKNVDVKIITATNQDLKKLVYHGKFRKDLYYRLKVIEFEMPPLRERKEVIDGFINYFLNLYNREYTSRKYLSKESRNILNNYHWPGNIRELKNLIHNLVIMASNDEILPEDIPETMLTDEDCRKENLKFGDLKLMMEAYEKNIVERCFQLTGTSRKLGQALQISQTKASRLIRKYQCRK